MPPPYGGSVPAGCAAPGEDLGGVQNSNIQDLYSTRQMNSASLTRNWAASGPGADRFAHSAGLGSMVKVCLACLLWDRPPTRPRPRTAQGGPKTAQGGPMTAQDRSATGQAGPKTGRGRPRSRKISKTLCFYRFFGRARAAQGGASRHRRTKDARSGHARGSTFDRQGLPGEG